MEIPWTEGRCILCLGAGPLTDEHLIPQALGGKLFSKFLCNSCNSTLGTKLEAKAKADPLVLTAAANLGDEIPKLSAALINSHPHIAHSANGPAKGYVRNEEFFVKSRKLEDGSLIQPTKMAKKTLMRFLQKDGCDQVSSSKAVSSLEDAPENVRIEIAPGLEVIKWRVDRLEMDLSQAYFMDPLIPVKTAYEFLACLVGEAICTDAVHLAEIRSVFKDGEIDPTVLAVERLYAHEYKPFHGIYFEGNDPYAKVQVRFFGRLAFRVHFLRLSIGSQRCAYTHRLDNGEEGFNVPN